MEADDETKSGFRSLFLIIEGATVDDATDMTVRGGTDAASGEIAIAYEADSLD